MGTFIAVELDCDDNAQCEAGFSAVRDSVGAVDNAMSIYHPSEITRINAAAGSANFLQPISVSTREVLAASQTVAERSAGAFDITIKPLAEIYGFYQPKPVLQNPPDDATLLKAKDLVDFHQLHIAGDRAGLTKPGMGIDLGGIAKGFALDQAAGTLIRLGIKKFTFNFGGQILAHRMPASIQIAHPLDAKKILLSCRIDTGSISVSAQNERFVTQGKKRLGHLVNPRTGLSEERTLLTMVYHPQAMLADAWSTALFFSDEASFRAISRREGLAAYRLGADGVVTTSRDFSAAACTRLE